MQTSNLLSKSPFFRGIETKEIPHVLECLGAFEYHYKKNSTIIHIGEALSEACILVSGTANVTTDTPAGKRSILKKLQPQDVFNEAVVFSGLHHSPVHIIAMEECIVVKIGMENVVNPVSCSYRAIIIENLLQLTALDYMELNRKLYILSHRHLRDRIMLYLTDEMSRTKSCSFHILFNRNEMADYLQVERSALSRELGRMRDEKLIAFQGSHFDILQKNIFQNLSL